MQVRRVSISKKVWALLILLALAVFGLWWLGEEKTAEFSPKTTSEKLQVVTSGYAAYAIAREIGGEQVALSMLVPPGTEPHHFEPTPGSIIAVQEADLFLYTSNQAEPWVADILSGLQGARAVAIANVAPGQDPHVWMTPSGALAMARQAATAFSAADPAHQKEYRRHLKQFEKEMQRLQTDFSQGLAVCTNREVVHIGHLAFEPLAEAYGLKLHALTGTSDQAEHSVQKLSNLVRLTRRQQVPAIFTEEMVSPALANTVAQETNARVLPLQTIEEISKADFEQGLRYEELMRRNLRALQEGLACQA